MFLILTSGLKSISTLSAAWYQAGFRKGRKTRVHIANVRWIIEKARELQKNIYFCFIDHFKAFDCVDHNKQWKIFKEVLIHTMLPVSWETCMWVKQQLLELDMKQPTGFKLGKEDV